MLNRQRHRRVCMSGVFFFGPSYKKQPIKIKQRLYWRPKLPFDVNSRKERKLPKKLREQRVVAEKNIQNEIAENSDFLCPYERERNTLSCSHQTR